MRVKWKQKYIFHDQIISLQFHFIISPPVFWVIGTPRPPGRDGWDVLWGSSPHLNPASPFPPPYVPAALLPPCPPACQPPCLRAWPWLLLCGEGCSLVLSIAGSFHLSWLNPKWHIHRRRILRPNLPKMPSPLTLKIPYGCLSHYCLVVFFFQKQHPYLKSSCLLILLLSVSLHRPRYMR